MAKHANHVPPETEHGNERLNSDLEGFIQMIVAKVLKLRG